MEMLSINYDQLAIINNEKTTMESARDLGNQVKPQFIEVCKP